MRAALLAFILTLPIGACASPQRPLDGGARPGDFTLGVVHRRDGADARYVLDASGTLRASFGEGSGLATNPGFTRTLTFDQLDELWRAATAIDAPVTDGEQRTQIRPGEPEPFPKSSGRVVVELSGRASRRVVILDTSDPDAAALLERLAAYSWADRS